MRIYMVMSVLDPIGGIEAALLPLALELKARGNDVIVYLIRPLKTPNQNAEVLRSANIPITIAPGWLVNLAQVGIAGRLSLIRLVLVLAAPILLLLAGVDALRRRRSLARSFQGAVGRLRGRLANWFTFENLYYWHLGQIFLRSQPDVVHVHGWGCGEDPPGLLQWLRSAKTKAALVFTEHNSPDPAFMAPIPNAPMNLADNIVAVSQAACIGLQKVGLASRPIHIIPYSVEPLPNTTPTRDPQKFTVVCVARLMPQKGHRYLLEAFAQVLKDVPNAHLKLAGAGELRAELEVQCQSLGIQNHVEFLGIVTRNQLPALYARCDVVALASLWEGLPVTLIEALSAGMPIVAADAGGNAELVINGVNGFIVPSKDAGALADGLVKLAKDPSLRPVMGAASRQHFVQGGFAPASVADRHLQVYTLASQQERYATR
jgi:glycosyltransferase involved in cell wall biosynthesis